MPFTFPNPLDTTEFTAANSITYSWDNADGKWRVKTYLPPKGPTVDLGPTPPLKPGGPSDGDLWFNTSPDDLTLYIYSEDTGTWIPAASVSALEERVAENEALQIQIVQRLQANEVLTNFHSNEIVTIKGDLTTLQNEIVELEEEIDAIAPSVERGTWKFNLGGAVASQGQITMYDGMDKTGSPIGLFKNAQAVWLNELDSSGTPHGFANVVEGDLLELFVEGDADYGLFTVDAIHDETAGTNKYWVIDVEFVRSLTAESKADNGDNLRLKIIKPPSGGTADGFVLKSGDTMEGPSPLVFKTKATGTSYNSPPSNSSYLKFENDKNGSTTSGGLWFGGNTNILTTDLGLMVRGSIYTREYYYAYGASSTAKTRIRLQSMTGSLQSDSTVALSWDVTGLTKIRLSDSEGSSGKVLRLNSSLVPYWSDPPSGNAKVAITCSSTGKTKGDMWYCSTDGVLYLKVS